MAVHKSFASAFKALNKKIELAKKKLINEVAIEGTRFWLEGFDKEGFNDNGFERWKPRQIGYRKIKKKDVTRKILIKTGRLKRAVNNSVVEKNAKRVVWLIRRGEVPYAAYVNEGTDKMPRRHFMGKSRELNRRIKNLFKKIIAKSLN